MSESNRLEKLAGRYRHKGLLVDTNLLVVLLIGTFDLRQLRNCRATKAFEKPDFGLLQAFVRRFKKVVTTPHILAETSNLAGRLPEKLHRDFRRFFARVLIERLEEKSIPAAKLADDLAFIRVGITDAAIAALAPDEFLVLTDDLDLFHLLGERKVDVINFNHYRLLNR